MRARVFSADDLRDIAEDRNIPLDQVERDFLLLGIAARLVQRFPSQLCFKGGFVLRHGYGHDRFSGDVDATRHNPARHKLDQEAVATEIRAAGRPLFSIPSVSEQLSDPERWRALTSWSPVPVRTDWRGVDVAVEATAQRLA
ncbi:MAG: nucleotidyl transferase AbiEii/AbiGii toxin family protein, partial [Candidatus Dormibacteria bacterium]